MKYIFTWLLVILGIASAFAQKDTVNVTNYCGTKDMPRAEMEKLPWYGNNQFLYNFLDSLEGNSKNGRVERVFEGYQVAVQAWVYHKDDGSGIVPENWEIMRWLNMTNEIYEKNHIPIKLYLLCNPVHVNRTLYYENISTDTEFEDMLSESYNPNTLNIHFVWDNYPTNTFEGWNGLAKFPYNPNPYSFGIRTNRDVIGNRLNQNSERNQKEFIATLIHELGHCLGLLHTHQGHGQGGVLASTNAQSSACYQEYVDRNKTLGTECNYSINSLAAERNGDFLVDTPADPLLLFAQNVDVDCNYFYPPDGLYPSTDKDGIVWQPSTNNFMSYSRPECTIKDNFLSRLYKKL